MCTKKSLNLRSWWLMTAVFFLIIPNFCNFLILLQQGVVDNPTFLAMSLTGRVASFCKIDNIWKSIISIFFSPKFLYLGGIKLDAWSQQNSNGMLLVFSKVIKLFFVNEEID